MRTAWHPAFTRYLKEHAPRRVEVSPEVPLTAEPLRVDEAITRRRERLRDPLDEGVALRGLWRHLRDVMLLEFKSRAREFRRGDLQSRALSAPRESARRARRSARRLRC